MLVDHQIERLLPAIPADGFDDRRALATAAHDVNPPDGVGGFAASEVVREPPHLVPSLHQCPKISLADPLGPSRLRVHWVSPVEHQETHELRRVFMDNTFPADNNKTPCSVPPGH